MRAFIGVHRHINAKQEQHQLPLEDFLVAKCWAHTVHGPSQKPSEMASIVIISVLWILGTCWAEGLNPALLDSSTLTQCAEYLEQLVNIPIGLTRANCQGLI